MNRFNQASIISAGSQRGFSQAEAWVTVSVMSQGRPLPVSGHGVGLRCSAGSWKAVGPFVLMVNLGRWVCGLKAEVAA